MLTYSKNILSKILNRRFEVILVERQNILNVETMTARKLQEIKKILKDNKKILAEMFKVKEIGIFGSYVRDEQKEKSDVDILVEFEETISLIEFVGLENYLSDLIGIKVDLVMKSALKPRIGKRILNEAIYI